MTSRFLGSRDRGADARAGFTGAARIAIACAIALVGSLAAPVAAHVGSPDTWFEGKAGPYPIRVVVRAPGVVPGLAQIDVRDLSGAARSVTVQPFAWNAGSTGAPPPDVARPVPGDPRLYSVNLWFMIASSYGVHVRVRGDQGEGLAIVPVQATASQRLPMDPPLVGILIGLGLFLFAGLVTIAGAAVRHGTLPPGEEPEHRRSVRARVTMAVSAVVLGLALCGGRVWWKNVDRAYAEGMYRPFHTVASVVDSAGARWVRLAIDDPRWRGRTWTPLISDHGKLMHLFLVRDPDLGAIAHLHPTPRDSDDFEARLPPLPRGRYRVYADIVHESGFAQTLTASLDLDRPDHPDAATMTTGASNPPYVPSDRDDSWFVGAGSRTTPGSSSASIGDRSIMIWERGAEPIVERRDQPLRFRVVRSDGTQVTLEPYLGMIAHAVVTRADGAVFAHLHPIGTVSMASEMALVMRTPADSLPGSLALRIAAAPTMSHVAPLDSAPNEFSIPYGFPRPGRYRVWVQVKLDGTVRTAAFDVDVRPAARAA